MQLEKKDRGGNIHSSTCARARVCCRNTTSIAAPHAAAIRPVSRLLAAALVFTVLLPGVKSSSLAAHGDYVFLTPAEWTAVADSADWAIPRSSLGADTLLVRPRNDSLSPSLIALLASAGVDTLDDVLSHEDATVRVAGPTWSPTAE